ncbi:MAG: hypothetical protein AAB656_03865 [Patescibacteria group bacterium]
MTSGIDLDTIARHIVFLHGPSGGGKSVLQKTIEERLPDSEDTFYLASGDCFRALDELNPEMAKEMRAGKFIGTLDATMPKLEETIGRFLDRAFSSNTMPVLVLDGFLRIGEYERKGRTVPSQVDQVAGAFTRVIQKRVYETESDLKINGTSVDRLDLEFVSQMEEIGTGGNGESSLNTLFSDMIRNANHYYLDVKPQDAEALMRNRSDKDLALLAGSISGRRGKLKRLKELLTEASLIQRGDFLPISYNSRKVQLGAFQARSYIFKPIPKRYKKDLENQMNQIVEEVQGMVRWKKDEEPSFSGAIKKLIKGKGVNMTDLNIPRDDDLTHERREKRIYEFQKLAVEGILKGELGFVQKDEILVPSSPERQVTIVNGPSRGVTLDELKLRCQEAVMQMKKDITPSSQEGRVFGKER